MQRFGTPRSNVKRETPQTQAIPGREQEMSMNNAGGFSFTLDKWKTLERFLILGTEGGTYYVGENKLNKDNTANLKACLAEDFKRTIDLIVDISVKGRSARNDIAIFALAVAACSEDELTRAYALISVQNVCRIGTHILHFVSFLDSMRGWGRGVKRALNSWYILNKTEDQLAFQMLKYQQRDGWSHRDVLRLAHIKPETELQSELFKCAVGKQDEWPEKIDICKAYNLLKKESTVQGAVEIIKKYNAPREIIPTQLLNEPAVWKAMLPGMPATALIRNLGKMSSIGILKQLTSESGIVIDKLTNEDYIRKARVHPIAILNAWKIYANGSNEEGAARGRVMQWEPNVRIVEALEKAFYISFGNVEPTGKSIMLALDVSGSMNTRLSNSLVTAREASALMAMVTARVEKNYGIFGFTAKGQNFMSSHSGRQHSYYGGQSDGISELAITPNMSFDQIVRYISSLGFCATDCSLPMQCASQRRLKVDTFAVYTDNETYAGSMQPSQALRNYRNEFNPKAKSVVVGMTATGFTIADPKDAGMLDVVGFDTNTPALLSQFASS